MRSGGLRGGEVLEPVGMNHEGCAVKSGRGGGSLEREVQPAGINHKGSQVAEAGRRGSLWRVQLC